MKHKSLVLSLAAFSLIALANGCNKPETATPPVSSAADKTPTQPAAVSPSAPDAQAAADTQKAVDAQKQLDAAALKQAEADKADQVLKQAAADKLAANQAAAEKQSQLAAGSAKVQSLIDTAKKLSTENKWADVLKILSDLEGQKLTPSQQGVVDGLKSDAQKQAQDALAKKAAQDAGNSVGGLLNPKK